MEVFNSTLRIMAAGECVTKENPSSRLNRMKHTKMMGMRTIRKLESRIFLRMDMSL